LVAGPPYIPAHGNHRTAPTSRATIGGVFVVGVGMLALGIPLMLLCFAFGTKRFFRGETLTPETEVKVPDVY
jgi:hypothetical protein